MKLFRGWAVVGGASVGIGFSAQVLIGTAYTLLAAGIAASFGWELTQLAPGATFFLGAQVIGFPLAGVIVDRWGTLRSVLAGTILFALHLLLLSCITELWQLYALMCSMGIFAPLTYTLPYMRAISLWFCRRRGIALGVAAGGIAFGGVLFPLGIQRIIEGGGWSQALWAVAGLQLFICLPLLSLLVRDEPRRFGLWPDGDSGPAVCDATEVTTDGELIEKKDVLVGLTFKETLRTLDFWLLGSIYLIVGLAVYGVVTNTVHILNDVASLGAADVAKIQAVGGLSVLVGRLAGGAMLDRLSDRWIAFAMTLFIAAGIFGYAYSTGIGMAMVGAGLIGFSTGGEGDVLPYMAAKYFGTRAFGSIYGGMGAMFGIGTALGPVTYAALVGITGSVHQTLMILGLMTVLFAFPFLFIGRRRHF